MASTGIKALGELAASPALQNLIPLVGKKAEALIGMIHDDRFLKASSPKHILAALQGLQALLDHHILPEEEIAENVFEILCERIGQPSLVRQMTSTDAVGLLSVITHFAQSISFHSPAMGHASRTLAEFIVQDKSSGSLGIDSLVTGFELLRRSDDLPFGLGPAVTLDGLAIRFVEDAISTIARIDASAETLRLLPHLQLCLDRQFVTDDDMRRCLIDVRGNNDGHARAGSDRSEALLPLLLFGVRNGLIPNEAVTRSGKVFPSRLDAMDADGVLAMFDMASNELATMPFEGDAQQEALRDQLLNGCIELAERWALATGEQHTDRRHQASICSRINDLCDLIDNWKDGAARNIHRGRLHNILAHHLVPLLRETILSRQAFGSFDATIGEVVLVGRFMPTQPLVPPPSLASVATHAIAEQALARLDHPPAPMPAKTLSIPVVFSDGSGGR